TENASSAILIEANSGTPLYEKNAEVRLPPASMTKIMTMLLIMDRIENGSLKLTDTVRTSEYAASMGGSQIFLETGESMTVHEMLKGIAIGSANDASMAMAEHIAGSEDAFVGLMNEKVRQLGLQNTHFMNPTGLPSPNHYSSAKDMSVLAQALLKYPMITKYTGIYEDYLRQGTEKKFWLVNTNRLVKFYPGTDGLKTGFTQEAKYCLTGTAKKNGMRVIAVIMGAPTPKERNRQVTSMFDYAFSQFRTEVVMKKGTEIAQSKVIKGKTQQVVAVVKDNVTVVVPKGNKSLKVNKAVSIKSEVEAPVKKGQKLGEITLQSDAGKSIVVPVVAKQAVEKGNWFDFVKRALGYGTHSE
ncbi:MAG: D-alanyl-D-alanine carboxypeptidase family protein, partial [Bacilli bacterium]